ncbi:FAD:protein FMN transferase [Paenibacillus qinlingensis]|uniref:FAD:protein FMN transferase n=1 Tax=Paenibacillus qinlingensis TaxID=1837343 RepID=UPI001565A77E|nr:FAD:protein FMN transferase [Paenibacillus qinlingensis]NQX59601.1 FAD:protein FMN transferase [Paenibacillus qinlingensis]
MLRDFAFRAMNSYIQVLLESETPSAELEIPVLDGFAIAEQQFSRFLPASECSYLNARSGQLSFVSDSMLEVLELARHYQEQTDGAFDICVGQAMERAGYRQSFESIQERIMELEQPDLPPHGRLALQVDPWMKSIRILAGHKVDFGGIVKSWTAQHVANRLQTDWLVRRGFINAGGDVRVWGGAAENEPWCIGIANPFETDPTKEVTLQLRTGAVATSSILRRRWLTNAGEMHHLIDTRTMRPSLSSVVQCTVVGQDLVACEVWAKVLCVLGMEEGIPLFQRRSQGLEALIYTSVGDVFQVKPLLGSLEHSWTGLKGEGSL